MRKLRKSIASILVICILFGALCMVPSSAKQVENKSLFATPYSIQWTYISSTSVSLTKSYVFRLNISASTDCYDIVDSCGVTATLQKYTNGSWQFYQQWSAASTPDWPNFVSLYETKYVLSGTYRVVTSHSATSGNTTEYASMYSQTVTI